MHVEELDEQGFDKDGTLHALPPEKVDQALEGARLNKLQQERIDRGQAATAEQEGKTIKEREEREAAQTQSRRKKTSKEPAKEPAHKENAKKS